MELFAILAVSMKNSKNVGNITITNSTFYNNTSTNGGALYYTWPGNDFCTNSISNSSFINNSAKSSGGAVYYDVFRPNMTNNLFQNNSAPYGNDIASYPVRIIAQGDDDYQISIYQISSGQLIANTLILNVVDYDNQTITNLIKGSITIASIDLNTKVQGRNSESIVSGVSTFNGLILIAKPGSNNVQFSVTTSAIDNSVILKQFGKCCVFI